VRADPGTETEVEGRRLTLTNLDKVLYPEAGFTKADVISYYVHIAPVLLPHLARRPVTFVRFPDGVEGQSFFEKRVPRGAPEWIGVIDVPRSSRGRTTAVIRAPTLGDLPSLVWAANLAALELHVPLWRALRPAEYGPFDLMVFDLDPGAPATIVECCRVAQWLVEALAGAGHGTVLAKTSGSKGLQLYVPLRPALPWETVRAEAQGIARAVEREHRGIVVSNMRRDLRPGKVLIDWSQNTPAKTTVAAYSLRARARPTVSTPVTLGEVDACAAAGDPDLLRFVATEVLDRVERFGDLFAAAAGSEAGSAAGSEAGSAAGSEAGSGLGAIS
jgi:bifunctional non-homologous end joining protein LigD